MNVSKQELDALTRAVITEVSWAERRADFALLCSSKDDMDLAKQHISDMLIDGLNLIENWLENKHHADAGRIMCQALALAGL